MILRLILCLLFTQTLIASNAIFIRENVDSLDPRDNIHYLKESEFSLSIGDVLRPEVNQLFKPLNQYGRKLAGSNIWLKVRIFKNHSPFQPWVLHIDPPFKRIIDFYVLDHNGHVLKRKKYHPNYLNLEFPMNSNFQFIELTIPNGQFRDVYVRIRPIYDSVGRFGIETKENYVKDVSMNIGISMGLLGAILIACLIGIAYFFITKLSVYLYYSCYLASLSLVMIKNLGLDEFFIEEPQNSWIQLYGFQNFFALLSILMFTKSFLRTRKYQPTVEYILKGLAALTIVTWCIIYVFDFSLIERESAFNLLLLPTFCICSAAGAIAYRSNKMIAVSYLCSWGIIFIGAGYSIAQRIGIIPLHEGDNFVLYGTVILQVTYLIFGQKILQTDMEKTKMKADESEKFRQLVRILCHDIANPLSVTMLNAQRMLRNTKEDPKVRKAWKSVLMASENQLEILNSVREIESIESGKRDAKLIPVSLKHVFDKSKFIFSHKLESKDLALNFHWDKGDDSVEVMGEPMGIATNIFNNLISNAIKFSFKGKSVDVYITSLKDEVKITIKDSGIGIPASIKDKLFDAMEKTTRKGTDNEKGTGFGMPLVKNMIDLYGGRIEIDTVTQELDPVNHGTSFHIYLQKVHKAKTHQDVDIKKEAQQLLYNGNALVADDDKFVCSIEKNYLQKLGMNVDCTNNAEQAISSYKEKDYKIVFVDQNLGGYYGKNFINEFPKDKTENTYFYLISAQVDVNVEEIKSMGWEDFIAKPLTFKKFEKVVEQILEKENTKKAS